MAPSSFCKAGSEQALQHCEGRLEKESSSRRLPPLWGFWGFGLPSMLGKPRKNFRYAEKISLLKDEQQQTTQSKQPSSHGLTGKKISCCSWITSFKAASSAFVL